jgi:hypothetical protein
MQSYSTAFGSKWADAKEMAEYSEKSITYLQYLCFIGDKEKLFFDAISDLLSESNLAWDPLPEALKWLRGNFLRGLKGKTRDMRMGCLKRIRGLVKNKRTVFHIEANRKNTLGEIDKIILELEQRRP